MDDLNIFAPNSAKMEMRLSSAIKRRHIILDDAVDEDSIFEVCFHLNRIIELDERTGEKKPVFIEISSYGGFVYSGLKMVSLLEHMIDIGYEIIITVTGYAMSMGQSIALTGTKRRAYRHARFMVHAITSGTWDSLQGMQDDLEETEYLWKELKEHIKKYSKITEEQLEFYKERKKDWYFSAQEALELGVIDEIL